MALLRDTAPYDRRSGPVDQGFELGQVYIESLTWLANAIDLYLISGHGLAVGLRLSVHG